MGQTAAGAANAEVFLFGRRGYDDWASVWPHRDPTDDFTAFINSVEKVVLTHRLDDVPEWNNTRVVSADFADRIRQLKTDGEGDITMSGSATTVRWLQQQGLLDELNLLLHPIVVGHGQRLFEESDTVGFSLESSTELPNGVVHLRYQPTSA
jgi:dihydrofolate reductase